LQRHDATGVERFHGRWAGHQTQPHAHPEYQITMSVKGCGRMSYLHGEARVPAGCLLLFHPGERHVIGNAVRGATWEIQSLHVPARWLEQGGAPLLQPAPLLVDGELGRRFRAVWSAFDAPRDRFETALATLAALLRTRPGLLATKRPGSGLVRRTLAHLAATLDRPVSMAELSRVTGASPSQVRKAVTAATGLPPLAWHLQRRIQEGKRLLASGGGIAPTALATGFADQAHFTRHFTRLVGVSPWRYARGVQGSPSTF
jgi:AraC-like DNA-binding protein